MSQIFQTEISPSKAWDLYTGFQSYITCEECKNIFKTNRILKVHKLKCKSDKIYKCDECDDIFESYSKLVVHRENKHRTVQCEICEVEIYFKNITGTHENSQRSHASQNSNDVQ